MAIDSSLRERYRNRLDKASGYGNVWEIVKDSTWRSIHKRRNGMALFLDDLPIQLGAYHSVGTNNIVLNRTLVQIVEVEKESKLVANALIYNLLLHEYLHALGEYSEDEVRRMVYEISKESFGEEHIATTIARKSPWTLFKGIPAETVNVSKRVMQIVKDFEKTSEYIV